jgi:hypothetical protein
VVVRQATWANQMLTRGTVQANGKVPRGTPVFVKVGYVKNLCGPGNSNPEPPPPSMP